MKIEENPLNAEILRVWRDICPDEVTRMPLVYPKLQEKGLLFIGINPSYSAKGLRLLEGFEIEIDRFFAHPNIGDFSMETALQIEAKARNCYPYYAKFKKLSEKHNLDWEHIDLFQFRETSQKVAKEMLTEKDGKLNEFAEQQLTIARKLIEQAKPKAIVVANALASRICINEFGLELNTELGCHIMDVAGVKTPVFLASMLSGQRAMDNHSVERLNWHIGHVLSKWAQENQ